MEVLQLLARPVRSRHVHVWMGISQPLGDEAGAAGVLVSALELSIVRNLAEPLALGRSETELGTLSVYGVYQHGLTKPLT